MTLLAGYRVLDFGRFIAGPYCATLLGDLGADVIRIERVEGGEDRCVLPVVPSGEGGMFLQLARNKRCLTLDIASAAGRDIVKKLIKTADVVVANLPRQTLKQLGLDFDTVHALNPRTVLVTVNAYGNTGPLADALGFDGVGQAMSGAMAMTGEPDAPRRAVTTYIDFSTAQACAMGALAALWARDQAGATGKGQLVEGSLLRSAVIQTNSMLTEQNNLQRNRIPQGTRGFGSAPSDAFKTLTGWVLIQTIGHAMFGRWCKLVGQPALVDDPRFATDELRGNNSHLISDVMRTWCATRTREDVLAQLEKAKLPGGPVYALQEALDDPQIAAAGLLTPRAYAGHGDAFLLTPHPVDMSGISTTLRRAPPQLGEHTDEVLMELGFDAAQIAALRTQRVV